MKKVVDLYDAAGNPLRDANGRPRYRWEIVGVRVVHVWDASQLDPASRDATGAGVVGGCCPARSVGLPGRTRQG